jgi:NitT/TauT family transport system ATP-binding protein
MSETSIPSAANGTPAIRCVNVSKVWGSGTDRAVEALSDFNLDVGQKEFVVLLGPSGCGKSTLLYLIAGLEDLTGGTIEGHGVPVTKPDSDRSLIFQESSLYPWRTAQGGG